METVCYLETFSALETRSLNSISKSSFGLTLFQPFRLWIQDSVFGKEIILVDG
jgi:hypothetical protein